MSYPARKSNPPSRILLATDLSARCDRALDRAAQLAAEWQAELVAVNVAEDLQNPDMVLNWAYGDERDNLQILQQQLHEDLAGARVPLIACIVRGEPAAAIADAARNHACELIVTGMARSEPFGRFLLGTTVEKLARSSETALLVVRRRPHEAYRRILVGTDFSEASSHALLAALAMFPGRQISLYHAVKPGLADLAVESGQKGIVDAELRVRGERFLQELGLDPAQQQRIDLVLQPGALESSLTQYVRQHGIDLAVIGNRGEGGLLDSLLGSSAAQLLDWLPCDTLLVPATGAADS